jgi:HEAT repeat protein
MVLPGPAHAEKKKRKPAPDLKSGPVSVEIPSGVVRVGGARVGKAELGPGKAAAPKLSHAYHHVAGRRVLHVRIKAGERGWDMVLGPPPARKLIFSGATGLQGVDGEWSRHVKVSSAGVLVYQRRERVDRCDGAPVYLFPRMWDFNAERFRPVASVPRGEGIKLTASRGVAGVPKGPPLNAFRLVAASTHQGDDGHAVNLAPPSEAEDGNPGSAWSESLGGAGLGEFLTARRPVSPYRLRAVSVIPGDAASAKAFREANRLKSVLLVVSPGERITAPSRYQVTFPVDPLKAPGKVEEPFWIVLPKPVPATCATLLIRSVYRGAGKGQGRTAIAELRFYTELEFSGGLEQVVGDLGSEDEKRGATAVRILSRLGKQGVEVVDRAASDHRSSSVVASRAAQVLTKIRIPEAAGPLCKLAPRVSAAQRREAMEALTSLGTVAATHLVPLLSAGDVELRTDVARTLGRIGGETARQALLSCVGQGSDELRRAVTAGLSSLRGAGDLEAVLAAAESARESRRRADLVLAAGRMGAGGDPAVKQRTAARIAALWRSTSADLFELRYRIIGSLGRLDPGGQLPVLREAAGGKDGVLRWFAVEQIRRVPGREVAALLRRYLEDSDPRVRSTAALALGRRARQRTIGIALARRLEKERWTMVARVLAEGLGRHCVPEGIKALRRRLVVGPRGVDVRALLSIAACSPPDLDRELIAMVGDRKWRTPVRQRALELIGRRSTRARAKELTRLFAELRQEAARSEDGEALAVTAAKVLGRAGGKDAAEALADALALDPHESIRAAAAAGLGRLCDRSARATMKRALQDASRVVRGAAKRANKRCGF